MPRTATNSLRKIFLSLIRRARGVPAPTSMVRIPLPTRGGLFVSPMPYGPYDTRDSIMKQYLRRRIPMVLMLVTDAELKKKARRNLMELYRKNKIEIQRLPIADLTAPRLDELARVMPRLLEQLKQGRLAVHCNAGVGRTGVIAACLTVAVLECDGEQAIAHIREHMLIELTDEQRRIIMKWAARPKKP